MAHILHNYSKNYTRLQNNYHPESSANQAVWKSDNQGIEEVTFIQTGKRGRDVEMPGKALRHGMGGPTAMYDGLKSGRILQEQRVPAPQQTTQPRVPRAVKIRPHKFWL